MTELSKIKSRWLKNSKVKLAYQAHAAEFKLARALIAARTQVGLTQVEVAKRMKTSQSVIARMEGGSQLPSMKSILRYAQAIGRQAEIHIVPIDRGGK